MLSEPNSPSSRAGQSIRESAGVLRTVEFPSPRAGELDAYIARVVALKAGTPTFNADDR